MNRLIVPAEAAGEIVVFEEGLSFWGGVDPATGDVVDAHHDRLGTGLSGKIVMMPTSRGSCSGSGVLLELAMNGRAPQALIFREAEDILTLGALIAAGMFAAPIAVARLDADSYAALASRTHARLDGETLTAGDLTLDLQRLSAGDLELTETDRSMLAGGAGNATRLAMNTLCVMAAAQGATQLTEITRAHIDGCIYAHEANLLFAEKMAEMGAQVRIPTTINAISVDRDNWQSQGVPPTFGKPASRLADAYVSMGCRPTFTCAPYLLDDAPGAGEDIGWSESNAVIYANSVLGARSAKHPDYLDLFIAMTGRAPHSGVYLPENRRARTIIDVELPATHDDALWPLLGWVMGRIAPDRIPLLRGVETAAPTDDDLKALCAAFGTTSAAPLLHIEGVTPEAHLPPADDAISATITHADLEQAWRDLNRGPEDIDLVALGSPHFSLSETRRFADLLAGRICHPDTTTIITLGRDTHMRAASEGLIAHLHASGVRIVRDLCWCSITDPIFPGDATTLMTNSGKYAHYAPGLSGRRVRFAGLSDCADAAVSGHAPKGIPDWLK